MGTSSEGVFTLTIPSYPRGIIFGDDSEPIQSIYEEDADQQYHLGTKLVYADGRVFRYAKDGGSGMSKALMSENDAVDSRAVDELQSTYGTSQVIGDQEIDIDVTTGGSWTENAYGDGVMLVNKGTGIGDIYKIIANAINGSDDTLMRVLLESPIRTTLAADTELTLVYNKWRDVSTVATTAVGTPTGIPLIDVTANYFCWLQTSGQAPCICDTGENLVIGEPAGLPAAPTVAGACGLIAADTDTFWGTVIYDGIAGEVALLDLKLDS
jgi:hypothetical protein